MVLLHPHLSLASLPATEIHALTEHIRDPAFDDISFFLRMPSSWDGEGPERDASARADGRPGLAAVLPAPSLIEPWRALHAP